MSQPLRLVRFDETDATVTPSNAVPEATFTTGDSKSHKGGSTKAKSKKPVTADKPQEVAEQPSTTRNRRLPSKAQVEEVEADRARVADLIDADALAAWKLANSRLAWMAERLYMPVTPNVGDDVGPNHLHDYRWMLVEMKRLAATIEASTATEPVAELSGLESDASRDPMGRSPHEVRLAQWQQFSDDLSDLGFPLGELVPVPTEAMTEAEVRSFDLLLQATDVLLQQRALLDEDGRLPNYQRLIELPWGVRWFVGTDLFGLFRMAEYPDLLESEIARIQCALDLLVEFDTN